MKGVVVVVCAAFSFTVSVAKTEIICLRTKGVPESTAIFNVEAAGQVYVCMYVWSSHIAEYGSTG